MKTRVRSLTMVVLAVLTTACDSGPKGPGILDGTVEGPTPLGAVVLEVTGLGVEGFVGQGDTQAYGALLSPTDGRHRVVLVDRSGGLLQFGIRVSAVEAEPPLVTVVQATGADNQSKLLTGVEALLIR